VDDQRGSAAQPLRRRSGRRPQQHSKDGGPRSRM
jgi:hypothetical protein